MNEHNRMMIQNKIHIIFVNYIYSSVHKSRLRSTLSSIHLPTPRTHGKAIVSLLHDNCSYIITVSELLSCWTSSTARTVFHDTTPQHCTRLHPQSEGEEVTQSVRPVAYLSFGQPDLRFIYCDSNKVKGYSCPCLHHDGIWRGNGV